MKVNDQILCTVTGVQSYGVFVKYGVYTGLIHISEMSDFFVAKIEDICIVGDIIETTVLEIDEKHKKLKLSYKLANPIHPQVKKIVKIRIGFQSLAKALPEWIEKASKK